MRRTRLYQILICLLCLFPVWTQAQSLTQYEYWIDDNFSARKSAGLSGYEADIDVGIDASRLGNGLHKLCLRVQQSDGMYSPITTQYFFKAQVSNGGKLEYWFDGNRKKLNTVDCHVSSDGEAYLYTSGLDLTAVTPGYHTMYYRFTNDDGTTSSAVSMASIIVTSNLSNGGKLEYWFDDDRENVNMVDGKVASTGDALIFNSDLDLKDVSQGMHRMYYRLVDAKGKPNSAVSMTPVMVKSLYSNADTQNMKMKKYSIAIDDEKPIEIMIPKPDHEVLVEHSLDVRDLKKGDHKLNLRFGNSLGTGVFDQSTFTVEEQKEPSITLMAEVKEGLVHLQFDPIPNDLRYRIIRVDANGVKAKVGGKEGSSYPITVSIVDDPGVGDYTYYVQSAYTDFNGTMHSVLSNEVSVNVSKAQSDIADSKEFGSISGSILISGNRSFRERVVHFSDGVTVKSDIIGSFHREKIPVGTTLTITVDKDLQVVFPETTITIVPKTNYVTINGEKDDSNLYSDAEHDLQFDSFTEITPGQQFRFKVKNVSRVSWTGLICVKSIKKEYVDNPPENTLQKPTNASVLAGSVAPFEAMWNYDLAYSDKITLAPNESKDVYIAHKPFHWPVKDEYYYFFFESIKNGAGSSKLIAVNPDYNISDNPYLRLIERSEYIKVDEELFEDDVRFVTNFIVGECSAISELDEKLGKLSNYFSFLQEVAGNGLEYVDYTHLKLRVDHAVNYSDLLYDAPLWRSLDVFYQEDTRFLKLTNKFRDDISTIVRGSKDVLKLMKQVNSCLDFIQNYNKWQGMTTTEQIFALSDKLLDYTSSDPFSKILKMYLDVTKKSIQNALLLGEKYHSDYGCEYFSEQNQLSDGEREKAVVYKQNRYIDFKIKVKRKGWLTGSFDGKDVKEQIYNVTVTAVNHNPNDNSQEARAVLRLDPIATEDGVYLRQIGIEHQGGSDQGYYLYNRPIEDMWMNIEWRNGRVTRVPLRHGSEVKGDGVKYDGLKSPLLYTVTFQSAIKDKKQAEHLADIINLDD